MIQAPEHIKSIKPYVPGKPVEELERELGITGSVKIASNENPNPSPLAIKALRKGISDMNRYPDGDCYYLRDALAARLDVGNDELIFGNGSNEIIELAVRTFMGPGDEAVMAHPSFVVYSMIVQAVKGKNVIIPLKDAKHDLDAMASAITGRTRIIFIANPNNPTGTIVSRAETMKFIKQVPSDVVIAFDEAYFEFVDSDDYISGLELFSDYPNIVVFRTFSKIYGMAGARIGYAVAPKELVGAIQKVREPFNINMLAQVGAYYSLDCDTEISRRAADNLKEKTFIEGELKRLNIKFAPSQANFIYADMGKDALVAAKEMQELGVIVRAFPDSNYVRVTIGTSRENRCLVKILERYLEDNNYAPTRF